MLEDHIRIELSGDYVIVDQRPTPTHTRQQLRPYQPCYTLTELLRKRDQHHQETKKTPVQLIKTLRGCGVVDEFLCVV